MQPFENLMTPFAASSLPWAFKPEDFEDEDEIREPLKEADFRFLEGNLENEEHQILKATDGSVPFEARPFDIQYETCLQEAQIRSQCCGAEDADDFKDNGLDSTLSLSNMEVDDHSPSKIRNTRGGREMQYRALSMNGHQLRGSQKDRLS